MRPCQLSVVIPCRNYGRYITAAVESILHQQSAVRELEVLVIDDHSSAPDTLSVLSHWSRADPRVHVIQNTGRPGAAAARNLGIAAATGEWIAFLDADDVWVPGGLQSRWQIIDTQPAARWIGADFLRWYEDGSLDAEGFFKSRGLPRQRPSWTYTSGTVLRLVRPVAEFLQASLGWTGTIMVRKDLLTSVGGFEVRLGNYEDHHLWIRLAHETDFFFVPQVVALYRQHAASVSREDIPPAYWYIQAIRLLMQNPSFRSHRQLLRYKLALLFEQNASYHRMRGEPWGASLAAAHAVSYRPSRIAAWKTLLSAALGRG